MHVPHERPVGLKKWRSARNSLNKEENRALTNPNRQVRYHAD